MSHGITAADITTAANIITAADIATVADIATAANITAAADITATADITTAANIITAADFAIPRVERSDRPNVSKPDGTAAQRLRKPDALIEFIDLAIPIVHLGVRFLPEIGIP